MCCPSASPRPGRTRAGAALRERKPGGRKRGVRGRRRSGQERGVAAEGAGRPFPPPLPGRGRLAALRRWPYRRFQSADKPINTKIALIQKKSEAILLPAATCVHGSAHERKLASRRRSRPALRDRQTRSQGRGPGLQVAAGDRRALAKPATAKIAPIKRNRRQILLPASANLHPAVTCVHGSAHGCKLASRRQSRPALRDRQTRSQVAGPACKSPMATVFDDQGPAERPGDKFRRRQISCLRAFPTPCPSAGFVNILRSYRRPFFFLAARDGAGIRRGRGRSLSKAAAGKRGRRSERVPSLHAHRLAKTERMAPRRPLCFFASPRVRRRPWPGLPDAFAIKGTLPPPEPVIAPCPYMNNSRLTAITAMPPMRP